MHVVCVALRLARFNSVASNDFFITEPKTSSEDNFDEHLKNEEEEDFEIPAFLRKQKF